MKPKNIIRLRKVVTEPGEWKVVTGKARMPSTAFPLSRNYSVQLGRNWHWRVDQLAAAAEGGAFRLLTAFLPDKEEFRAWLAAPRGAAYVIVAQLEFHGTHPGWHCHAACHDLEMVEAGQGRPRTAVRLPASGAKHRRQAFGVSESDALAKAFKFFNVTGTPEGALL